MATLVEQVWVCFSGCYPMVKKAKMSRQNAEFWVQQLTERNYKGEKFWIEEL